MDACRAVAGRRGGCADSGWRARQHGAHPHPHARQQHPPRRTTTTRPAATRRWWRARWCTCANSPWSRSRSARVFAAVADASPAAAFARLRRVNPAPAMFFLNDGAGDRLFGASPDLQLVVQGRTVQALPVCGTVARRAGPVGEAESFRELVNEDTDAASLAVCSDALRHDLAPLCEPGTLHLRERRRQMSLATVVHTVDRLQGTLREGADAWDAIAATTAPAMVTGTPRAPRAGRHCPAGGQPPRLVRRPGRAGARRRQRAGRHHPARGHAARRRGRGAHGWRPAGRLRARARRAGVAPEGHFAVASIGAGGRTRRHGQPATQAPRCRRP
jgi:hypothetical protein